MMEQEKNDKIILATVFLRQQ